MCENRYDSIISLAMRKLNPGSFSRDELVQFACLAIRIGLDPDTFREILGHFLPATDPLRWV